MITDADKAFMSQARADMLGGRTFTIILLPDEVEATDPDTGEEVKIPSAPVEVQAHVTESPTYSSSGGWDISDGLLIYTADIKADINIEDWVDVTYFEYNSDKYRVIRKPQKGISKRNRVEVFGELIT
ncbi:hypothetical protein [Paenilisteria rocourtiae]|uniref:Uncharacterized protein n=1 Tax=Listeria rocourtiae TaxID=647910 RepID=A0A4R6ZRF8_9LIST|nr:hypothetical protein [Listeria rocourtiae]EUJ44405.1 hypothetical protein PROCOU_13918 [Listeria rocourtiae FSL F6-920]TDR55115.1 hypothetical protein DFP96_10143 [Listeria rocourtiae]